jgi:hypothetical protein
MATRHGWLRSGRGMWTSSTPSAKWALMAVGSVPRGSLSERAKAPEARSILR